MVNKKKRMGHITVLVTCIGGFFAYDTIRALRIDKDLGLRVIGVDANPNSANRAFVDSFHEVPMARQDTEQFVATMLDICLRENVDILIPGADEEALALAKHKERFLSEGIHCTVQDIETLELMGDKFLIFEHLGKRDISLPDYYSVSNVKDLSEAAEFIGYPQKKMILKPRVGRGARGLILVDCDQVSYSRGSEARGYDLGNINHIGDEMTTKGDDLGLIAMEFLPGSIFDVDCVANLGEVICLVPRRRLVDSPWSRGVEGHVIERNVDMENMTVSITKELGLSYAFDCDFGTTEQGKPGLLEINPRWSGSVAAGLASNINVPSVLVRSILGLTIPEINLQQGKRMVPITSMGFPD